MNSKPMFAIRVSAIVGVVEAKAPKPMLAVIEPDAMYRFIPIRNSDNLMSMRYSARHARRLSGTSEQAEPGSDVAGGRPVSDREAAMPQSKSCACHVRPNESARSACPRHTRRDQCVSSFMSKCGCNETEPERGDFHTRRGVVRHHKISLTLAHRSESARCRWQCPACTTSDTGANLSSSVSS
jgi:hypothetical protein